MVDNVSVLFRLGLGLSDALRRLNTKLDGKHLKVAMIIGLNSELMESGVG